MTEKRYYKRDFEELFYIIDSQTISEEEFDKKVIYEEYRAFQDSLTGEEIVELLNENEQLKSENKELMGLLREYVDSWSDEKKQALSEISNLIIGD